MNSKGIQRGPHAPGTGLWRALGASLSVHATVLGAGLAWGLLAAGGEPRRARVYTTAFAPPSPLVAPEEREPLEPTPPPEPAGEPDVCVSEVWSDPVPLPALDEPVPDEIPVAPRALDWFPSRPLAIGALAPAPDATAAAPGVAGVEPPPAVASPEPPAPVVAEPVAVSAPRPGYPRLSRRAGEEGSVLLRLHLGADGRVLTVEVVESSGHERLDRAASETLAGWRFEPRREDGRAVAASILHRVTFRLREG